VKSHNLLKPAENTEKYQALADLLRASDDFLITAHIRADGDAVAAICFMKEVLDSLEKRSHCVLSDPSVDPRYGFLRRSDAIHYIDTPPPFSPVTALILDSPTMERIGPGRHPARLCRQTICIDHHLGQSIFSPYDLVDTSASSTCEILARLLPYLNVTITHPMIEALYTGIVFDTGNFRFSNTSGKTLRTASALVEMGADPERINFNLFYNWSLLKVRAMAQVLQSIRLYQHKRIAVSHLPAAFFAAHPGSEKELEGFSDLGVSLKGVKIAVFLKEREAGAFKISLRAVEAYDVGSIAEMHGGGGHRKAAGCSLEGSYTTVCSRILKTILTCNPTLR